jgi:vesicle transport through interaction with t-SNAREs protein 1
MEIELPSMPVSIRQNYQQRLQTSKQGLERVKRALVCLVTSHPRDFVDPVGSIPYQKDTRQESQRSDLLSGPGFPNPDDPYSDEPASAFSARTRLLQGTDTLADGSRKLENAHRVALETEDVGADILRNLRGQREQIEHTRDQVGWKLHLLL